MCTEPNVEQAVDENQPMTMTEFLESIPPNRTSRISDLSIFKHVVHIGPSNVMHTPEIQLHCSNDDCNGVRFFCILLDHEIHLDTKGKFIYLIYQCSNCRKITKTYAILATIDEKGKPTGEAYKFGELPIFGPQTPSSLIGLIGPDRETFLQGRRCENQGLGIGAFVYYRRVVERQKDRILNKIIEVSEKIDAPAVKIDVLKQAVDETQFKKALNMTKDVMPESLLIDGHNPLLLLHGALSEGVHALTDERCLELASSVRIVLGELSERLSHALKNKLEMSKALSALMNHKND